MKTLLWIFPLLLSGCASTIHVPQRVDVPVPIYCAPHIPVPPPLAVRSISSKSSDAEIARAYVESLMALSGDDQELRKLLRACHAP